MLQRFSRWALAMCLGYFGPALLLAAPLPAPPGSGWTEVSPKDGGFAIQMPGIPEIDSKRPGRFAFDQDDGGSWIVEVEPLESAMRAAVESGDRKNIDRLLMTMRDLFVSKMHATLNASSAADFQDSPSIFFSFSGVAEGKPVNAAQ